MPVRIPSKQSIYKVVIGSLEHWKKMRKCVRKIIKSGNGMDRPTRQVMLEMIQTDWSGEYCPLCALFSGCGSQFMCPIEQYAIGCNYSGSAWREVSARSTWDGWLFASNDIMRILTNLKRRFKDV